MITSSKPAHSITHHRPVRHSSHTQPLTLRPYVIISLCSHACWPPLVREDDHWWRHMSPNLKCLIVFFQIFTSLAPQSLSRSCTGWSGVRVLRVAWVHRRWILLRDEKKKSLTTLGAKAGVRVIKQRGRRGEKLTSKRLNKQNATAHVCNPHLIWPGLPKHNWFHYNTVQSNIFEVFYS